MLILEGEVKARRILEINVSIIDLIKPAMTCKAKCKFMFLNLNQHQANQTHSNLNSSLIILTVIFTDNINEQV